MDVEQTLASDQSIVCTCAATPPTMPTWRDEHLPDCPVAVFERGIQAGRSAAFGEFNRRALALDDTYELWTEEAKALPSYAPYRDAFKRYHDFLTALQEDAPDE